MFNNSYYLTRLMFYFVIFFYLVFNAHSKNIFTGNGLLCELDYQGDIDNLIQAYYFYDEKFLSYSLSNINGVISIIKSGLEEYKFENGYLLLKGLKIDKNSLHYKTMGGKFFCTLLSKKKLEEKLNFLKSKRNKIKD